MFLLFPRVLRTIERTGVRDTNYESQCCDIFLSRSVNFICYCFICIYIYIHIYVYACVYVIVVSIIRIEQKLLQCDEIDKCIKRINLSMFLRPGDSHFMPLDEQ